MEDEELLDLDTLTELLAADDTEDLSETKVTENPEESQDLRLELEAMRERVKLLESQLQKQPKENVTDVPDRIATIPQSSHLPVEPKKHVEKRTLSNEAQLKLLNRDIFGEADDKQETDVPGKSSLVHHGDTDSSDDDERRNCKPSSLNDFGKAVKKNLAVERNLSSNFKASPKHPKPTWKSSFKATHPEVSSKSSLTTETVETDPYSGLRIINPLVSSNVLRERMTGRKMIRLSLIKNFIRNGDIDGDWVTIGVLVHRSDPRTSKNGKTFTIWKLNDLRDLDTTVSLFLFGDVHKNLWKTSVGSVIGLLNSRVMPNREGDKVGGVCLTIDHPGKVMLIGQSKDFGSCKGKKKDGSPCYNLVNRNDCEFCAYHVQAEYKKAGRRMELQSSYSGVQPKGVRNPSIKAKILNKNGVMYGGQLYTVPLAKPEPTKNNSKQKDRLTLNNLKLKQIAKEEEQVVRNTVVVKHLTEKENQAVNGILSNSEFLGGMLTLPTAGSRNLIKHLVKDDTETKVNQGVIKSVTPKELLQMHKQTLENHKRRRSEVGTSPTSLSRQPKIARYLTKPEQEFDLELTNGSSSGTLNFAKVRALAKLSEKPIQKVDPNSVRKPQKTPEQTKKILEKVQEGCITSPKPQTTTAEGASNGDGWTREKIQSRLGEMSQEMVDRIMKMKSSHSHEVDQEEALRINQYFNSLEKKEQLEKKMQTITEITVTVVSCKICKYTSHQPSELCARENHLLKRHKALKRFFRCVDCKHRTYAFSKLPTKACRNCGSNNFEKTAMMKPKQGPKLESESLLIRGEEIKFIK